jgi:hypothetical protein
VNISVSTNSHNRNDKQDQERTVSSSREKGKQLSNASVVIGVGKGVSTVLATAEEDFDNRVLDYLVEAYNEKTGADVSSKSMRYEHTEEVCGTRETHIVVSA